MAQLTEEHQQKRVRNRRVHMANERTFLAWIRTSIGIMAFGFVVEKFALFLKQLFYYSERLGLPPEKRILHPPSGYSSAFGVFLVGLGTLMGALAFIRYKLVEKQIDEDTYRPSMLLNILLTAAVLAIGAFLLIYLIHSI